MAGDAQRSIDVDVADDLSATEVDAADGKRAVSIAATGELRVEGTAPAHVKQEVDSHGSGDAWLNSTPESPVATAKLQHEQKLQQQQPQKQQERQTRPHDREVAALKEVHVAQQPGWSYQSQSYPRAPQATPYSVASPYSAASSSYSGGWPASSSSQTYPGSRANTPRFVSSWPRAKAFMPGGCNIPMWGENDYACEEEQHAKPEEVWTDSYGVTRKLMASDAFCNVQCPKYKWWTQRDLRMMFCKHGKWVDFLGSPIEKIKCGTASWCLALVLFLIAAAIGGCVASAKKNKQEDRTGTTGSTDTLGSSPEDVAVALEHANTRDQMETAEYEQHHSQETYQERPLAPAHETEGEL